MTDIFRDAPPALTTQSAKSFISTQANMKLIITIDTEEDNWNRYSATDNPVTNIERIPALQRLFDDFEIRPTYMVTYPVATYPRSVEILKEILEQGKCEIGAHCHPWNTPPFDDKAVIIERDTMLCNLPEAVVHEKLSTLHHAISENFRVVPVSFRAGRWGFGPAVARSLCRLGYKVDTSVTAFTDWSKWHGVDYRDLGPRPYRFSSENILQEVNSGELLQMPASVGFLQKNYNRCNMVLKFLDFSFVRKCKIRGLLHRLKILNKVELSPEMSTSQNMIALANRMQGLGFVYLNMFFHSTSLVPGMSPFVKNREDEINFFKRLEAFFSFTCKAGIESITLSQVKGSLF